MWANEEHNLPAALTTCKFQSVLDVVECFLDLGTNFAFNLVCFAIPAPCVRSTLAVHLRKGYFWLANLVRHTRRCLQHEQPGCTIDSFYFFGRSLHNWCRWDETWCISWARRMQKGWARELPCNVSYCICMQIKWWECQPAVKTFRLLIEFRNIPSSCVELWRQQW